MTLSKTPFILCAALCLTSCHHNKTVTEDHRERLESLDLRHLAGTITTTTVQLQGHIDTIDNSVRFAPTLNTPAMLTKSTTNVSMADTTTSKTRFQSHNSLSNSFDKVKVSNHLEVPLFIFGVLLIVLLGFSGRLVKHL